MFVTAGMTLGERQLLLDLPGGLPLFEFLSSCPGPLWLRNLTEKARALGVTSEFMALTTLLGAPIRHRGVQMGNFYLGNKKGGREFTDEDEEILVMFANQTDVAALTTASVLPSWSVELTRTVMRLPISSVVRA